jgi:uncharacterized flavoprotein (TIGR03862 family)
VAVADLRAANCGFNVSWSTHFVSRYAGHPLKAVNVSFIDILGNTRSQQGDVMITANGIEGGVIYALSADLREVIAAKGNATLFLDLIPNKSHTRLSMEINHPRGSRSISSHLQSRANITGVKAGLLRELVPPNDFIDFERLALAIKCLPIPLISARPLEEAISSAGGVVFKELDEHLMLYKLPGIFCAGEMLDWEAPTGGYLLTACFSSGRRAGLGVLNYLR